MADLVAKIEVSDEAIRIVEEKIRKALQPLWKAQYILAELIDEYQPPEPYWTPIIELHHLICGVLTEHDVQREEVKA